MSSDDRPSLDLHPHGLYVVISRKRQRRGEEEPMSPSKASFNNDLYFQWGLYWCKSSGVGHSFRYKERDGKWELEHTRFPSGSRQDQVSIEANERILAALHIENMHENMADLLGERLGPQWLPHSHRFRPRSTSSTSRGSAEDSSRGESDDEGRGRKWLGHALVMLNSMGFISLKDEERGAAEIEEEASSMARLNMAPGGEGHKVAKSRNVIFDSKG